LKIHWRVQCHRASEAHRGDDTESSENGFGTMGDFSGDGRVLADGGAAFTSDDGVREERDSLNGRAATGDDDEDYVDGLSTSVEAAVCKRSAPTTASAIAALVVLSIPVVALGVRALLKPRGLSERSMVRAARRLMVDVDEEMVQKIVTEGSGGEQSPLRIALSSNLSQMPWDGGDRQKVVGTLKPSASTIQEVRNELRGFQRRLSRRSRTWCGLVNPTGVIAVELGLANCVCIADDTGEYSPWSSIVARGLFGYRCSSGLSPTGLVIAARKGSELLSCGKALIEATGRRAPPDDSPRRYLVAEDVFGVCEETMVGMSPSVIEGVKRWAGTEQAQSLSLCQWLYHRVSGLRRFIRARADGDGVGKPTTGDVLDALVLVQNALHLDLEALNASMTSIPTVSSKVSVANPSASAAAEDHIHAKLVAEELSKACYSAMNEGLVFVVPTSPGLPPRMDADELEIMAWEAAMTRLNSLAALAGIPQVSIPIEIHPLAPSASPSSSFLGISLLTRQNQDLAILRSLEKLHGFIARDARERASRPKGTGNSRADAEAEKALGNECFKNKQYSRAAQHYTRCIAYDETNPVYPSNRAMAHLKMGAYQEAERDCDLALRLDQCNAKALLRRGAARAALGSYKAAAQDYARVLDIEPGNRQAKDELARLRKVL
jgi:tetratricopeptide (TPR) repeat protein